MKEEEATCKVDHIFHFPLHFINHDSRELDTIRLPKPKYRVNLDGLIRAFHQMV